jgi:hypothetical protein
MFRVAALNPTGKALPCGLTNFPVFLFFRNLIAGMIN